MNPQKLAKWKRWLGDKSAAGTIRGELSNLANVRKVFSGVAEMVRSNPALQQHSLFYSVFSLNYQDSVLMYVRRQVRRHRDSVSLIGLASEFRDNCETITMEYYISLWAANAVDQFDRDERARMGRSEFLEHFGGAAETHLDRALIERDIADLEAISDASSSYTDRRLAHLDRRGPDRIPTHKELESWCDTLDAKLEKFFLLLNASTLLIPPVLQHEWQAIFRVPWLPESSPK